MTNVEVSKVDMNATVELSAGIPRRSLLRGAGLVGFFGGASMMTMSKNNNEHGSDFLTWTARGGLVVAILGLIGITYSLPDNQEEQVGIDTVVFKSSLSKESRRHIENLVKDAKSVKKQ